MLLPPPTPPASPVIKATTASRAHNQKRNGRKSSCFVRAKAGEIDSTAEARFGTQHLSGKRLCGPLPGTYSNDLGNIVQWQDSGNNDLSASAQEGLCFLQQSALLDSSANDCRPFRRLWTYSRSASRAACAVPSP